MNKAEAGAVAYTYDPRKNRAGASFGGVPLTDLTAGQVAALPPYLQRSVDAAPFYVRAEGYEPPFVTKDRKAEEKADKEKAASDEAPAEKPVEAGPVVVPATPPASEAPRRKAGKES